MSKVPPWSSVLLLLLTLIAEPQVASPEAAAPLQLVQTIPLGHIEGRLDHLAVDVANQRVFIAALGNDTVEVLDMKLGTRLQTLTGFHEPQGVLFLPDLHRLVVTNGADGTCSILDGDSLKVLQHIALGDDADNIRYDEQTHALYVGYGHGAIGAIDMLGAQSSIPISLQGHPESFQLEQFGPRIFVNIPEVDQIVVIDRLLYRVVTTWSAKSLHGNFPMALDEQHHRLFVGCRHPARLLVFDTESGAVAATLDAIGDADDIFYDVQRKRIYISGGQGVLQVIEQRNADEYHTLAKIQTAPGARTSLFVPEWNQLLIAVPHRGNQSAEIRVYAVES